MELCENGHLHYPDWGCEECFCASVIVKEEE